MGKLDYRSSTLACVVIAGILGFASIILIIASVSWQGLVEYHPQYTSVLEQVTCVDQVPRREGFFYVCHTMSASNLTLNKPGLSCIPLDYNTNGRAVGGYDDAYWEITNLRRISLVAVFSGLILGFIGLILLLIFTRGWLRVIDCTEFRRLDRVLVGMAFLLAGFSCQICLTLLHMLYTRDKVLHTNVLPLLFTSWIEDYDSVVIRYSHSYFMLTSAVYLLEIAGIVIMIAGHFFNMLDVVFGLNDECNLVDMGYNPSMQRFSTGQSQYDEPEASFSRHDPIYRDFSTFNNLGSQ